MTFLKKFIACERGATAIEYGLIAALISIVLITAMNALAPKISGTLVKVSTKMPQ
ncbi:Flp family type IVb pilin [Phenylobacterium sp. 20VBR1]|uniref:Flp family type IVb pilin n=1 Tax=Phenylobacterium glaciei TaxID=2803784 RepID=A0A941D4I5_9CAUL|nr:Flp family type IVb pilin [Phenylobacterium glaciei]MBR7620741.1 Flp family type IVb pilin [Phenylobacterium glaciei]QQZ49523.1 Flp family type IVb pilin [Phenylobacterium glaciei]